MKPGLTSFSQRVLKCLTGKNVYYYIILAVVPALVYLHAVKFGYSGFDDEEIIARKVQFISKVDNIPSAFKRDAFMNLKGDSFYRPVGNISFMIDAIIGGENLSVFHAHNILLHIMSLMLAMYLFTLMGFDKRISFTVLLLMSVHPLYTHAVCWIPARMDLLLAVFATCAFIMLVNYLGNGNKTYLFIHHLFFFLAVFSKETALLLPVLFVLYYYITKQKAFKEFAIGFLPGWILIIGVFLFMRSQVLQKQAAVGTFSLFLAVKNLQVIPTMLAKIFIPSGSTTMPRFQLGFVLIGSFIILAFIAFIVYKKREGRGILLFGFLWYLILSIPPAVYTNPMSQFGFDYLEHRAYVPMIGIAMCLCYLLSGRKIFTKAWKIAVVLLVFMLSAITYSNSLNYASQLDFYSAAIRENPESAMAYNSRSMYKFSNGDPVGAESDLDSSLAITSDYPPAWNNKGALLLTLSQYDSAVVCLNRALKLNNGYADAYVNRAIAKTNLGDVSGAIRDYKESLRYDSTVDYVHYNLGNIYAVNAMYESAVTEYTKALTINPRYPEALNNRANTNLRLNRFNDALTDCISLIRLRPEYQRAYYNQAKAYLGLRSYLEALESVNTAISLDSSYLAAIELRKQIIQEKGH